MSEIMVIAGPNGSGKTTAYNASVGRLIGNHILLNSDQIERECEVGPLMAGRILLSRLDEAVEADSSIVLETTLSWLNLASRLDRYRNNRRYKASLYFIMLDSPELAIERVKARVRQGGHAVPHPSIENRFRIGCRNFFRFRSHVDAWILVNGSEIGSHRLVASGNSTLLSVEDEACWTRFSEMAGS